MALAVHKNGAVKKRVYRKPNRTQPVQRMSIHPLLAETIASVPEERHVQIVDQTTAIVWNSRAQMVAMRRRNGRVK